MTNGGLTFMELIARLGVYNPADMTLRHAYRVSEEQADHSAPHGEPWHTSFHASEVPWDERWCARKLIFGLMDVPLGEPIDEKGRAIMDVGKDTEVQFVTRFHIAGRLVSPPPTDGQLTFVDREAWLSGSCDAVIIPLGQGKPHVVDPKGVDNENARRPKFREMQAGLRDADPEHVAQLQSYVNQAYEESEKLWPGMDPCTSGSLLYFNRARSHERVEFFYDMDREGYLRMHERLVRTRTSFEMGILPPHPFGGKEWSEEPCAWCPYKKDLCKPLAKEEKDGTVFSLAEVGEHVRKHVDETYDAKERREAVLNRWR
jgi:hypothetical protein